MRALVGLGGNLGSGAEIVSRFVAAEDALRAGLPVVRVRRSGVYWSEPTGPVREQPRFVNAALELELSREVEPVAILAELLRVEVAFGRIRPGSVAKGPRALDLDLLFVDRQIVEDPGPPALSLPHPGVAERAFVLRPLADLMGLGWRMPGVERSIEDCLGQAQVAVQGVERACSLERAWSGG